MDVTVILRVRFQSLTSQSELNICLKRNFQFPFVWLKATTLLYRIYWLTSREIFGSIQTVFNGYADKCVLSIKNRVFILAFFIAKGYFSEKDAILYCFSIFKKSSFNCHTKLQFFAIFNFLGKLSNFCYKLSFLYY